MTDERAVREEVNPQGGSLVSRLYIRFYLVGLFLILSCDSKRCKGVVLASVEKVRCRTLRYLEYRSEQEVHRLQPLEIREAQEKSFWVGTWHLVDKAYVVKRGCVLREIFLIFISSLFLFVADGLCGPVRACVIGY